MANFRFPFWKISFQKQLGAWSFGILVEDSDTGGPRSVDVRMECLFAYQFWYWELCIENLWGGGRKHFLLIFFSGSTFNIGGWGLMRLVLYTSLKLQIPCTYYTTHLQDLQAKAHLEFSRTSVVELFYENSQRVSCLFLKKSSIVDLWQDIWQDS